MEISFYQDKDKRLVNRELFNTVAQEISVALEKEPLDSKKPKDKMSYTQIRRFYNQLLKHRDKANSDDEFIRELPFIKMLLANGAYAKSRKMVNNAFLEFLKSCVQQVEAKDDLPVFCTLFEAVLAFSKGRLAK